VEVGFVPDNCFLCAAGPCTDGDVGHNCERHDDRLIDGYGSKLSNETVVLESVRKLGMREEKRGCG